MGKPDRRLRKLEALFDRDRQLIAPIASKRKAGVIIQPPKPQPTRKTS